MRAFQRLFLATASRVHASSHLFGVACAAAVVLIVTPLGAQESSHKSSPQDRYDSERLHESRDRWRSMDGERRKQLRRERDQLRRMEPKSRQSRLERAKVLRQIMLEVQQGMDPAAKAKFAAMPQDEARRLLGRLALEEARRRSAEANIYRSNADDPNASATGQGPSAGQEARKARKEQFLAQAREALLAHEQAHGIPKGVNPSDWQTLFALENHEFGRELRRMLHENPSMRSILPRRSRDRSFGPRGKALMEAMRLPRHEHERLVRLDREGAKVQELNLQRERVLVAMAKSPEFQPEELVLVREMSGKEFRHWIYENAGPSRRGPGGPGGRRGGREGSGRHPEGRGGPGGPPPPGRGGPPKHRGKKHPDKKQGPRPGDVRDPRRRD